MLLEAGKPGRFAGKIVGKSRGRKPGITAERFPSH
jgi:hypothetical protein